MAEVTEESDSKAGPGPSAFAARTEELQKRVNEAARALHGQGLMPTVARIRAALGGGSPNDLAPALKNWKQMVLPGLGASPRGGEGAGGRVEIPASIADVVQELWQRALVAASGELKGGTGARQAIARTEEAQLLREQVKALRDQLQREALAYGESRAQSARHEAIAKDAVTRAHEAEVRERDGLHKLGAALQRIAALEAQGEKTQVRTRGLRVTAQRRRTTASPLQKASAGVGQVKSRVRPRPRPGKRKTGAPVRRMLRSRTRRRRR